MGQLFQKGTVWYLVDNTSKDKTKETAADIANRKRMIYDVSGMSARPVVIMVPPDSKDKYSDAIVLPATTRPHRPGRQISIYEPKWGWMEYKFRSQYPHPVQVSRLYRFIGVLDPEEIEALENDMRYFMFKEGSIPSWYSEYLENRANEDTASAPKFTSTAQEEPQEVSQETTDVPEKPEVESPEETPTEPAAPETSVPEAKPTEKKATATPTPKPQSKPTQDPPRRVISSEIAERYRSRISEMSAFSRGEIDMLPTASLLKLDSINLKGGPSMEDLITMEQTEFYRKKHGTRPFNQAITILKAVSPIDLALVIPNLPEPVIKRATSVSQRAVTCLVDICDFYKDRYFA